MGKYIAIIVTVVLAVVGVVFGYGQLHEKANKTEEVVEEHDVRIRESEFINLRQTVILEKLEQKL